jgi:hypothetical protein
MRQDWASGTNRLLAKYDNFSRRHTDLLTFVAGTES